MQSPVTAAHFGPDGRLLPDCAYEVNGYRYTTDSFGRITSAEGELRLPDAETPRDPLAQRRAGYEDREPADDGGHLIGTRFGGSPGADNLIAQNRVFNRADYKIMENEWACQLEQGNRVQVRLEPQYDVGGDRPTHLTGSYTVITPDGAARTEEFSFTNIDMRALEKSVDALLEDDPVDDRQELGMTPEQRALANEMSDWADGLSPRERRELFADSPHGVDRQKKADGAFSEGDSPDGEGAGAAPEQRKGEDRMGLWDRVKNAFEKNEGDTPEQGVQEAEPQRTFNGLEVDKDGYIQSPDGKEPRLRNDAEVADGKREFQSVALDPPRVEEVPASQIEGVRLGDNEVENPDRFWGQHSVTDKETGESRPATKEDFLELASHIPEVRERMANGETLENLERDPDVGACATQYFDPAVMPRAVKGEGFCEMQDGGRHRILAAMELGYDMPVHIVGEYLPKVERTDNPDTPDDPPDGPSPEKPDNPDPPDGGDKKDDFASWLDPKNYNADGQYTGDYKPGGKDAADTQAEIDAKARAAYAEHLRHDPDYADPLDRSEAYADFVDKQQNYGTEDAPEEPDTPEESEDAPEEPDAPEESEDAPEEPDAPEESEDAPEEPD
ncbi:MAG: DNA/RNA non-specific endonuclease, partial [Gemmiger sp.]